MLFESSNQFFIAVSFVWLGILIGIVSEFLLIKTKNKVLNILFTFSFGLASIFVYFWWLTHLANANYRIYCVASFVLGIILEKFFWHKIFAKIKKKVYNKLELKIKDCFFRLNNLRKNKKTARLEKKLKRLEKRKNRKISIRRKRYDRKKIENNS